MNKKTFLVIPCICIALGISSCGHEHIFGDWQQYNSSQHIQYCSCGESIKEDHVFEKTILKEPTHLENGSCSYKCSLCGYSYSEEIEKLSEHCFDQQIATDEYKKSDATCLQKAQYYYSCLCGAKGNETFEYGELAPHSEQIVNKVEPTFTKGGSITYECSVCGKTIEQSLDRLGIEGKEAEIRKNKSISILTIGNSLTDDVCQHLHDILHAAGIENVTIVKMWVGGTGISYHNEHMKDNANVYTFEYYNEENSEWHIDSNKRNMEYAFNFTDYDYISLSTNGQPVPQLYQTSDIGGALNYVMENGNDAIPIWYTPAIAQQAYYDLTFAPQYNLSWKESLNGYEELVKENVLSFNDIQAVVPSITATEIMNRTFNWSMFHRDDVHYSYPIGVTLTGMMYAKTILPSYDFSDFHLDYIKDSLLDDMKEAVMRAYTNPYDYSPLSDVGEEIDGYTTAYGGFREIENGFESLGSKSLLYKTNEKLKGGSIEFTTLPFAPSFFGAVFGLSHMNKTFWEMGSSYYYAGINSLGDAFVAKTGANWEVLRSHPVENYDPSHSYNIKVEFKNGQIVLYVNDNMLVNVQDTNPLIGEKYGFRAESRLTTFKNIKIENNPNIELPEPVVINPIDGYSFRSGSFIQNNDSLVAFENNSIIERNEQFNGGTVTYNFTSNTGGESGFIFGLTNTQNLDKYWETGVSYYMAVITSTGGCGFASVNQIENTWIWLNEPTANTIAHFNQKTMYSISVAWDKENSTMRMFVDGLLMASFVDDNPLIGTICGFRAGKADNTFSDISFTSELPSLPDNYIDIKGGWRDFYNEETDTYTYKNYTNGALRIFKDQTISGSGTITFDYKSTGLDYNGANRSNWVAGLVLSASLDITNTKGPYMVIGKTPAVAKRFTSTFVNTSTTWNNPTGENIVIDDGEEISLELKYNFTSGSISLTGKGKTSIFTMPEALQEAGSLYIGLYGATMTNGNEYGEVIIGNIVNTPDKEENYIDITEGWNETINSETNLSSYTNNTNGAMRVLKDKKISGKGTITFDYTNTGLGYNGGAISNWCAGLLLTPTLNISSNKGPFMVIGKSSANTKRFTSIFTSDASTTAWKVPTGDVISIEDNTTYSITLNYDFSTGLIIAMCEDKTSTFTLVDELKNAGSLYLGLYGSTMTKSNPYGELKIENLNITIN